MDVLVIWFVFFVFVVAFVINRYFEKPACAFLAKKFTVRTRRRRRRRARVL